MRAGATCVGVFLPHTQHALALLLLLLFALLCCRPAQVTERIVAREAQRAEMLRTANRAVGDLTELPDNRTLLLDNVPKGSLVRREDGGWGGRQCLGWGVVQNHTHCRGQGVFRRVL
jgi:hypothetical protein